MVWKIHLPSCAASVFFFLAFNLSAQQTGIQFLSPAAVRGTGPGAMASVSDTERLPYLIQLEKERAKSGGFKPNASDLLIAQAEEKFRSGRRYYQDQNFDRARTDFDQAIDTMLRASAGPTDQELFEHEFEDMVDSIHRLDLTSMGAAVVETPGFDKVPLEDIVQMTFPVDPRIKEKVQSELKNTVSALPLVTNDVVLGYINYFSTRGRRTIENGFERMGRYRPMISRIFAEEGVPQELIHLAQAESGFFPRAVSRAAASGMWQFVKFRGMEYGLRQTPYSDDRLDPEKATRAAARHLKDLFAEFNDWYLAIAAYNCGPGNVEKAVEHTGYADFWELRARRAIPMETANYVPIILAMTIMEKNAKEYGLDGVIPEAPLDYDTLHLTAPTNLALISDLTETPLPELQQMNPALLKGVAPTDFDLHVPRGLAQTTNAALEQIAAERRASWRMHRVQPGETMATIAKQFNSTVKALSAANNLAADEPAPGDHILIPAAYKEPVVKAKAIVVKGRKAPVSKAAAKKPAAKSTKNS